jgi:hypothetical protein
MTAQPPDPADPIPQTGETPSSEPPAPPPAWPAGAQAAAEPAAPQPAPAAPTPPPAEWGQPPAATPGQPQVPGAPGRYFAATVTRVAALLIDSIVLGFIAVIVGAVVGGAVGASFADGTGSGAGAGVTIATGLAGAVVSFLYFTLLWRSSGKATLGQRVFRMQVGSAFDGATLTWQQATIRWLVIFGLGILAALPAVGGLAGLLAFIWSIVLLVSVATSATRQGFHDRWSGSAVVATGPQNIALAWGCLIAYIVALVLLFVVALAAILALVAVFVGTQS